MPHQVSTHASLLTRLGTDDDDAWREFHDRYHALIHGFVRARGLQPIDADDVTQEVLMEIHAALRRFEYDPSKGRFRGFLKTVTLRRLWKRQQPSETLDEAAVDSLAEDDELDTQWEAEWRQYHLRLAMTQLRMELVAAEFRAFELMTAEGRSVAETESETGVPTTRLYRVRAKALERLKELVAAQVVEEG